MAGQPGENEIANAAASGDLQTVWELLAQRLREIPGYVEMFTAAFDDVRGASDMTFVHAANAIAAFESSRWRCDDSPFDRYLRGDRRAMSKRAIYGMKWFYGVDGRRPSCSGCHRGLYQTDNDFHAIAMPQIGPGRGSNSPGKTNGYEDFGREQATGNPLDRLKFRTPSLRNVALTAPYGHSGAYDSLRAVVLHHLDPVASLYAYNSQRQAILPAHPTLDALNYAAMDDPEIVDVIAQQNELDPMSYTDAQVDDLMAFLNALTDPSCLDLRQDIDPAAGVPSGLPLRD
jgi:cytochrome c peroxidase